MKKIYKILILVIAVEFFILSILNKLEIKALSWIGKTVGVIFCFLPLQILLFCLCRDENITVKKRIWFVIVFWFINICILLGGILTAMEELGMLPKT